MERRQSDADLVLDVADGRLAETEHLRRAERSRRVLARRAVREPVARSEFHHRDALARVDSQETCIEKISN